jgi:hypothetical protein
VVIGPLFAWAHLPKAAGDATLRLWRLFPELITDSDDNTTHAKHDSFEKRLRGATGKLLVLNMRRLPAWNLSHAQHEARSGLYPDYRALSMPTADEIAERTLADDTLAFFTGDGRYPVDRWLRQERLQQDFLRLIDSIAVVSPRQRDAVLSLGPVNAARYDHDPAHWFSRAQIARMYQRNPTWAAIERRVYGDTCADAICSAS